MLIRITAGLVMLVASMSGSYGGTMKDPPCGNFMKLFYKEVRKQSSLACEDIAHISIWHHSDGKYSYLVDAKCGGKLRGFMMWYEKNASDGSWTLTRFIEQPIRVSPPGSGKGDGPKDIPHPAATKEKFESLYSIWLRAVDSNPEIVVSSRSEPYVECAEYRALVDLGEEAVPLMIDKIREGASTGWGKGEFFLWYAVRELSGVDFAEEGEGKCKGEQDIAIRYLKWWDSIHPRQ